MTISVNVFSARGAADHWRYALRMATAAPNRSIDWDEIRSRFLLEQGVVYLDGNSLGPMCRDAHDSLQRTAEEWRRLGIGGWFGGSPPWLYLSREVGRLLAPIVGSPPECVVATGSTTINLHQGLSTLFSPSAGRDRIIVDDLCFPTDGYAIASYLRSRGMEVEKHLLRVKSRDGYTLEVDDIVAAMTSDVALAVLPAVVFASGQLLDIEHIQKQAKARNIIVLWDCSHAVGAVPLKLAEWDCDYAFWCNYKYLNGGPGCVGGLFLNKRHFDRPPGMAGWFASSDESLFSMPATLRPAGDARRLQTGTPHVLSLAPLLGSLKIFDEIGMESIRRRSLELTDELLAKADERLAANGFDVVTPRHKSHRGGHLSLRHPRAKWLVDTLAAEGIITDFRYPDLIRVAPAAPFNTSADIDTFVNRVLQLAGT